MKHLALSLFLAILCTYTLSAQETDATYEMVDLTMPPSFPGGQTALMQFLGQNIQYPEAARKKRIEGTVAVTFVVERNGEVTNGMVVKDIGKGCGEEVLRVLKLMPNWTPGIVDGEPVKVRYTLPVRFRLN